MSEEWVIGIIGGSGLYAVDSLEDEQWIDVKSSFGEPSDAILCGRIAGVKVRFLPRHGRGHNDAGTRGQRRIEPSRPNLHRYLRFRL